MLNPASSLPGFSHGSERRRLAQRVADAHRGLDDSSLLAFVSGSVVDGLADARSDVDMSIVMRELPPRDELEAACRRALHLGATTYTSLRSMLEKGLDQQPLHPIAAESGEPIAHGNIRGPAYYH